MGTAYHRMEGNMQTPLAGIRADRPATSRLMAGVLSVAGRGGQAVLFVHGHVSSSLFWQPTMLSLPDSYRPVAIDLRGFGDRLRPPRRGLTWGGMTWRAAARHTRQHEPGA